MVVKRHSQKELKDRILKELDTINLYLETDEGGIEFQTLKGKILKLKFTGKCISCPAKNLTFSRGVKAELKERIPELEKIELVN